ncbi:MAG: SDR family NAD(P)-dependent oxidoreductase [Pseudomonadota bacterium]
MTTLSTLGPDANVAVIGASGGIGSAFVRALVEDDAVNTVYALSSSEIECENPALIKYRLDLMDEISISVAADDIAANGTLDLVIIATGILHDEDLQPEKSLGDIDDGHMQYVFKINSIGPALVAKYFLPIMSREKKTVFAVLSARVGSIDDNRRGGWVSYRASKAALNMTIKTLSIEHARRFPNGVMVSLHPGTVETHLSEPFRRNVPPEQLFSPETSADHLLQVIQNVTPADSGGFFAWDGSRISY